MNKNEKHNRAFRVAIYPLITILAAACTTGAAAQATQNKTTNTRKMETNQQSKDVVGGFFSAFGKGDINGVIESFHDSCTITAVRPSGRSESDVYGSYQGKDGVRSFLSNLGKAFDTKAFSVSHIIGEGAIAFANGSFTHILRSTGKPYTSDWALMCVVKDNKILEYHFYEDSGKFAEAQK